MKVVFQCAGEKQADAASLTLNGDVIEFLARPAGETNQRCPWDLMPGSKKIWIDCVRDLADNDGKMPDEFSRLGIGIGPGILYEAGKLYAKPIYDRLVSQIYLDNVYILSAGWGLIRGSRKIPDYDVTFSQSASPEKRVRPAARSRAAAITDEIPGTDEIHLFITPNYADYWTSLKNTFGTRAILHWRTGQRLPTGRYSRVQAHDCGEQRTNWQYKAATQFLDEV